MSSVEADPDPLSIDLTAMIDVIFILLIFWMTVTRLAEVRERPPVQTPVAGALPTVDVSRELLTVNLLADGRTVLVDDRRMDVD
ncbi:MAG: ExbD/TolR family protein, partial [Planctomycetota bacterium]